MKTPNVKIEVDPQDGESVEEAVERVRNEWARRTRKKPKRKQSPKEEESIKRLDKALRDMLK